MDPLELWQKSEKAVQKAQALLKAHLQRAKALGLKLMEVTVMMVSIQIDFQHPQRYKFKMAEGFAWTSSQLATLY